MSGKPVTSKPVYGYLMDKDENYIVDEEAAPVVRQIYQLCLAGNGPTKIARMLTEQQIPTPGTLEYRRTGSTRRYHPGYECKWATNTVVHLLENREYTGCLVNFKTEKPSYKVKHSVENPIEKQAIFPNHHHAGGRAGPRCASSPVGGVVPTPRATAGPRERTGHQSAHPTAQQRPDAFGERRRQGGFRTAHAQELNRPPHTAQQPSKSCSRRLSPRSSCMVFDLRKPAAMRPAKKTTRLGAR